MASSDNLRAIVEASSAGRSALFYPAGVIPKEPDFLEYYMSEEADGRQTDFIGRQRSLSGATMDLIDMRNKMKRSITDLFDDFKIEDSADVSYAISLFIRPRTDFILHRNQIVTAATFSPRFSPHQPFIRVDASTKRWRPGPY